MSTKRVNDQYSQYNEIEDILPASEIYITIGEDEDSKTTMSIDKLFYAKDKPITSFKQLVAMAKKGKVFTDKECSDETNVSRQVGKEIEKLRESASESSEKSSISKREIEIPTYIDSYSINVPNAKPADIVPFGLKRNVKMRAATNEDLETYALVKIDGETKYVKKSGIYYMTPDGKQKIENKALDTLPKDVTFYDPETNKAISEIYDGAFFVPEKIVAAETMDFEELTYTTYESEHTENGMQVVSKEDRIIDEDGNYIINEKGEYVTELYSGVTHPLSTTFSEQTYAQKQVEGKAGKTETIPVVNVRNFVVDQGKQFIVVGNRKIYLDQITGIAKTVERTENRGIYQSDLKVGKKINYTIGDDKKEDIELTDEIMSTLTADENGKKYLTIEGEKVYLDNITKVSYEKKGQLKKEDLEGGSKLTVEGEANPVELAEGQEHVFSFAGNHVYVTVNGRGQMVPLENLRDENNQNISNLSEMVGKKLMIVEQHKVSEKTQIVQVGFTDPLTYEQANLQYSTMKSFQPSAKTKADDTTYRKLASGEMVKESMINVPKAYKFDRTYSEGDGKTPEAWLIQVGDGGAVGYRIVSGDYFTKNGIARDPDKTKAVKRCSVSSNECIAIQTTSQGKEMEACEFCGKWDGTMDEAERAAAKQAKTNGITLANANIKDGSYIIDDALNSKGEAERFEPGEKRYEYTDTITLPDYAANSSAYKHLNISNVTIKDGKVVGGVNYKMEKGLTEDFSLWGKILGYSFGAMAVASFIPVVGAVVGVAYFGTLVAGPAVIVAKQVIKAGLANNWKLRLGIPLKDKATINQQENAKILDENIQSLYERMLEGNITKENFEHEIATLKQQAHALSRASENSSIKAVNGTANVTKHNVNAAIKYKKEYEKVLKYEKKLKKQLKRAEKNLGKGKFNPFRVSEAEYEALVKKYNHYANRLEALKNGEFSVESLDEMNKNTRDFLVANQAVAEAQQKYDDLNAEIEEAKKKGKDTTKLEHKLAQQKKILESHKNNLNETQTTSENLNSNRTQNREVAESSQHDLILGSIEDMRLLAYLQNYTNLDKLVVVDSEGKKDDKLIKIVKSLRYDKKLGITYKGAAFNETIFEENKTISKEEYDAINAVLSQVKENVTKEEQQRNEHYEEMSESEKRTQAQTARREATESVRAEEEKTNKQVNERIRDEQNRKRISGNAQQAMKDLKDKKLPTKESDRDVIVSILNVKKAKLEETQQKLSKHNLELGKKMELMKNLMLNMTEETRRFKDLSYQLNEKKALQEAARKEFDEAQKDIESSKEKGSTPTTEQLQRNERARIELQKANALVNVAQTEYQNSDNKIERFKKSKLGLQQQIDEINRNIATCNTEISNLQSGIATDEKRLEEVNKEIAELQEFINKHAPQAEASA